MSLWGVYLDVHPEVDLGGERESLRLLAERLSSGDAGDLPLDDPPPAWREGTSTLRAIRLEPTGDVESLIAFRRENRVLVISGQQAELARIVGRSLAQLADAPYRVASGSVPTHLHLDPTSDPDERVYSSQSISLVLHLADED